MRYILLSGSGVCVCEPAVLCCADTVSLLLDLRLGVVTCTKDFVPPQCFKYRKTTIICKLRDLHRRCSIVHRSLQMLSYKPIIYHTYKYTNFTAFIVCPSAGKVLLPARLLLQGLLPILDVISDDLSSLVGGEVAADGLDEVALRVYTWMLA
jgi:hypothetical protein